VFAPRFCFGPFLVFPAHLTLRRDGHEIPLIRRYFDLLVLLMANRDRVARDAVGDRRSGLGGRGRLRRRAQPVRPLDHPRSGVVRGLPVDARGRAAVLADCAHGVRLITSPSRAEA
jgi:hypothetical protein